MQGEKSPERERNHKRSLTVKFATPVVALVLIGVISSLKAPLSRMISGQIKSAVTLGVDVDSSLGKSRFLDSLVSGSKQVSAVKGSGMEIISDYKATGGNGAVIATVEDGEIKAASGGIIVENTGRNLEIVGNDGVSLRYEGCKETPLAVGTRVRQGDIIAVSSGDGIRIKAFLGSVQLDPREYLPGGMGQ